MVVVRTLTPSENAMKKFSLGMVFLVFAASVSACVVIPPPAPKALECADELGCVQVSMDEDITIAAMAIYSGPNAFRGNEVANAIELAIEDYGDILGHEISWLTFDSQCSRDGGLAAAQQIAANPSIVGIIGPRCSSAAITALPVISGAGLSMISPSNTSPVLTNPDRDSGGVWEPGYYRTAHNDLLQGALAGEFIFHMLGARSAATIHDGTSYSESLQQVMADTFSALGGEITNQHEIKAGVTDMRPALALIAADQPEILFLPLSLAESVLILQQVVEIPGLENTRLMSADASLYTRILEEADEAVLGVLFTGPYTENRRHDELLAKWEHKFGELPPSGFHSHAYDGAVMLLDAITTIAQSDSEGNLMIGRQAIRSYLSNVEGFLGISGVISCNPTGDCATGDGLAVFQVDDLVSWPPTVIYSPADR